MCHRHVPASVWLCNNVFFSLSAVYMRPSLFSVLNDPLLAMLLAYIHPPTPNSQLSWFAIERKKQINDIQTRTAQWNMEKSQINAFHNIFRKYIRWRADDAFDEKLVPLNNILIISTKRTKRTLTMYGKRFSARIFHECTRTTGWVRKRTNESGWVWKRRGKILAIELWNFFFVCFHGLRKA